MNRLVGWIDLLNEKIGRVMGWLMLALVLLVTGDVISRYLFNTGAVLIQELEWWMFSIIFLSCAGYTFLYDEHVRVDIIYSRISERGRHIVDLTCAFIFLFPMCILLVWTSMWYIEASWEVQEQSPDPGGLPAYYVLKSFIPLGFFLLMLQGLANVYRKIRALQGVALPEMADSFTSRAHLASKAAEEALQEVKSKPGEPTNN